MKMRLLSTVFLLTLFSGAAFCQPVKFGFMAGTDLHKVKGKSFDEEFKFGYHVGAFVEVKVKKIGLEPEVYFSQVNVKNGNDASSVLGGVDTKIKLSYLNIPVLLNLYFNKFVALQVGPQFGIVMNENNSLITNGENAFKKGDFSMVGGLQVKILKFRVYGRYIIGLNNQDDIKSGESWKTQTVHLGIGYTII